MLRRVHLVRTDVTEERSGPIIRVTRIGERRTLAVTSNRSTLPKIRSCYTLFRVRRSSHPDDGSDAFLRNVGSSGATQRYIPEYRILHKPQL
jgi:hypothetical protein